jgi:hypothetical protein
MPFGATAKNHNLPLLPAARKTGQKPFTRNQVQAMVRDGLGDEAGAKAGACV